MIEPTSILINRRTRRAKTERLDAEGMLRVLAAYLQGDRQACSMVRVPTPDEEDAKRIHREREHLVQERLRIEIASRHCCSRRVYTRDLPYAHGIVILQLSGPVMAVICRTIFGPSWTVCVPGSS
ncbi:hypothetical protein ABID25_006377 [Mesorhizobium abyssinicae]